MGITTTIYKKEDKKPVIMPVIKSSVLIDKIIFPVCFYCIFHGVKLTEVINGIRISKR
ncbi:hypothetical protein OIPHN330_40940 [Citrobacter freundii]|jgi:hypothetical protein|nr:hypothetical protein V172_22160 [Citrobacter freundii RLS1]KWZ87799.1 hypothetical protein HMPREF3212_04384 [Citrobacter freundii]GAL41543.1 hypothetical protein CIFRE_21_00540 [Citrobacter freundii ATCC 8090 = MTCC 1658 = NBRC 12681]CAD5358815.1 conserved protein of unknown function [Citrobacter freundii]BEJ35474.1 hypothetical protein OIPHN330_40940 [Citrobacter freundii]